MTARRVSTLGKFLRARVYDMAPLLQTAYRGLDSFLAPRDPLR